MRFRRSRVLQGKPEIRSISSVNEATSANNNEPRRAARKRYQGQYRALYDQVLEILFQLDPIGVHQDHADKFVPELATMLPRLREARIADDVEHIVLEELRRWYGRRRLANLDPERLTDATIGYLHGLEPLSRIVSSIATADDPVAPLGRIKIMTQ